MLVCLCAPAEATCETDYFMFTMWTLSGISTQMFFFWVEFTKSWRKFFILYICEAEMIPSYSDYVIRKKLFLASFRWLKLTGLLLVFFTLGVRKWTFWQLLFGGVKKLKLTPETLIIIIFFFIILFLSLHKRVKLPLPLTAGGSICLY